MAAAPQMRKRVYIAYTGGTIGMNRTRGGYCPEPGHLQRQMAQMPELEHPSMPSYTIHEDAPLLDSSNITPAEWVKIAHDVDAHYARYDGFVVLHGTDTMAYTASALPFMLHGLGKPVILTGSQIPLCEVRNDARENLITSLLIAAKYDIPEVCLYFGGKLLRGCRAVKVSASGFAAFASPNVPPLGTVGIDIEIAWDLVRSLLRRQAPARVPRGQSQRQRLRGLRLAERPAARHRRHRHRDRMGPRAISTSAASSCAGAARSKSAPAASRPSPRRTSRRSAPSASTSRSHGTSCDLYFGGKLLRGCRAVKVSASGIAAFASPNVPPLGTVGIDIEIAWDLVRS